MNQPSEKQITHVIKIPPLTSVPELLGNYRNLFNIMGIETPSFPFEAQEGFQHPVPESQQVLLSDYMLSMQLLQNLQNDHGAVTLLDARVTNSTATFVFSYKG